MELNGTQIKNYYNVDVYGNKKYITGPVVTNNIYLQAHSPFQYPSCATENSHLNI